MTEITDKRKVVVIGAGPVGALAALYAAVRGDDVEIYELRGGTLWHLFSPINLIDPTFVQKKGQIKARLYVFIASRLMFVYYHYIDSKLLWYLPWRNIMIEPEK